MRSALAGLVAALAVVAGCTQDPMAPTLTADGELQVRPALVRLVPGGSLALEVVAFDADGEPVFPGPVTWSSLDSNVISVDDDGVLNALSPGWGRVLVQSQYGAQRDTAVVAVGLRLHGIAAGDDYGCGWTSDGTGYCWGGTYNSDLGVLGTGSASTSSTPTAIAGWLSFTTIAAGQAHTCGVAGGEVYCWGRLGHGAIGTTSCAVIIGFGCHTPARVQLDGTFDHVAVTRGGDSASCASGDTGLSCWGRGLVADPASNCTYQCTPALISATLTGPVAVGARHGCALDDGGRAFCWGDNEHGQLGATIPVALCRTTACLAPTEPIAVATTARFTALTAGARFTCGLTAAGEALCWGSYNRYDWMSTPPGGLPVAVDGSLRFESIDAGVAHVCGLTADGALYCWGDSAWTGALGEPRLDLDELVLEPRRVAAGETFTGVAAGYSATCAITEHRGTLCFGLGSGTGQGMRLDTTTPLPLAPPGAIPVYVGPQI